MPTTNDTWTVDEVRHWPPPETKVLIDDLAAVSLQIALDNIEDARFSHHPSIMWLVKEQEMEAHEARVGRMELHFFQRDTGEPF